jgi:predicted NBD/HSP70 family sugar kinase
MFNPDKIILGGGVTLAIDLLQDALQSEFGKHTMSAIKSTTIIEISPLGMDAGAYGAIALAGQSRRRLHDDITVISWDEFILEELELFE